MRQYKIISKSTIGNWSKDLSDFYKKYYDKKYSSVFKKTAFVSICIEDKKIIGAVRTISDLKRFALLVDLRVDVTHQKQGIATAIIKNMLDKLVAMEIDHINLVATQDPSWLKKFYFALGFAEIMNSTFLEYKKTKLSD